MQMPNYVGMLRILVAEELDASKPEDQETARCMFYTMVEMNERHKAKTQQKARMRKAKRVKPVIVTPPSPPVH
jgi:hypothetical protein